MDLTIVLAEALGTDLATIGRVLMWLLVIALARTALAKAGVDRAILAARDWLGRRRVAARATRTGVDDALVHAGSYLLEGVAVLLMVGALIVQLVAWLTPRFAIGMQMAREQLDHEVARRRRPPGSLLGVLTWLVLALGLVVVLLGPLALSGCGPTQAQAMHSGLNAATDLADPLYQAAVTECDLQEGEVHDRYPPEQASEAYAALDQVRARCNVAFASFEELRGAQAALRATADAMQDGRATNADLVRSLDELHLAYQTTRGLVLAIVAARRGAL